MFPRLLVLLLIVPIIELFIIIETGKRLGLWVTLSLIVALGLLGLFLIRRQGLSTFTKIKYELFLGHLPADSLLDGLFILASGLLLLTPGLLTDFIGLSILIKPIQRIIKQKLKRWITGRVIPHQMARFR
ncbi:FxsA family protein [Desulforamulus reducens]|uniref:FxsA family protein n=1 Tax=Desulforamulus reducens TaxID=59610 RepID=UPI00059EC4E8|nr:FxsA family protein [Desulforamulus reducens]